MALRKSLTKSVSTNVETATPVNDSVNNAVNDEVTKTMKQVLELLNSLNVVVPQTSEKLDALSSRVDELEAKLNAALEDDDAEDETEGDEADDNDDDDGDEYTADDIDPNKVYDSFKCLKVDEQSEVLKTVMSNLGTKKLASRDIRKDPNVAFAVAEVICDDEFGVDVEDLLKD